MILWFLALVLALCQSPDLAERQVAWLEEQVHFLLSSREKSQFLALDSDGARDRFIEAFWKKRDPNPATAGNVARDQHLALLAEADRLFTLIDSRRGRHTERGRVYQLLGPPGTRERFAGAGQLQPLELWHYSGVTEPFLAESFYLIFYRQGGFADYRLWSRTADGPRALIRTSDPGRFILDDHLAYRMLRDIDLELGAAAERLVPGEAEDLPAFAGESLLIHLKNYANLAERTFRDNELVTSDVSFERLDVSPLTVTLHDAHGIPQLHYALEVPSRQLEWKVEGAKQRTSFQLTCSIRDAQGRETDFIEDVLDLEAPSEAELSRVPISFQGRLILTPGHHTLEIALRNTTGHGMATLSLPVEIPHPDDSGASQILLARSLNDITTSAAESVEPRPFQLHRQVVGPSPDRVFPPQEIFAFVQLWGLEEEASLHWSLSDGDHRIWQADSRIDPEPSGVATVMQAIPLDNLPDGGYTLALRFPGGKRRAKLRVDPHQEIPAVWVIAREAFTSGAVDRGKPSNK